MNLVWTSLYVFKWINLTYKLSLSRNGGGGLWLKDMNLSNIETPRADRFWKLTTSPDNSQFQKMMSDPKWKITARTIIGQNSASASGA